MPSVSGSFWIQSLPLGIASEQTTLPYGRHVRCPCRSNYHNARFVRLDGGDDDDDVDHHNANERTSERACGERWHFMSPCAHTHSHTRLTRLPITYHSCVLRWHTPPSHPVPGLCMLAEVPLRMVIYVILFFSLLPFCVTGVYTPYHKRHQITMFSPLPGGIQAQAHGLLYVISQFINTLLN